MGDSSTNLLQLDNQLDKLLLLLQQNSDSLLKIESVVNITIADNTITQTVTATKISSVNLPPPPPSSSSDKLSPKAKTMIGLGIGCLSTVLLTLLLVNKKRNQSSTTSSTTILIDKDINDDTDDDLELKMNTSLSSIN